MLEKTIPKDWQEWFINANDGSNEGIKHNKLPFQSVQFHPEATPGPTDSDYLFDTFANQIHQAVCPPKESSMLSIGQSFFSFLMISSITEVWIGSKYNLSAKSAEV